MARYSILYNYQVEVVKIDELDLGYTTDLIQSGKLVIFPFDTCYGLICDASNQSAVDKLINYKSIRGDKPISVAVDSLEMVNEYAYVNDSAVSFIKNFLPGPFTLILKSKDRLSRGVENVNNTIGIRIPKSDNVINLVSYLGKPVTATSANQSYKKTPYSLNDIFEETDKNKLSLIDLAVDAGDLPRVPPSTVLDFSNEDNVLVLRKGSFLPSNSNLEEFVSRSTDKTIELAGDILDRYIGNLKFRPLIFVLQGDMGAGKTHFVKGIGKRLGLDQDDIRSPTFIVSQEYELDNHYLYHIDAWRLNIGNGDYKELIDIGIHKMLDKQKDLYNLVVIEWGDKLHDFLNNIDKNIKVIWVQIDKLGDNVRSIKWVEG